MTAASGFKERFEKPSSTLTYGCDNQRIERVQHNREILKWVIKTIELCGKQCIIFRGHRENVASKENNCGNFLAISKFLHRPMTIFRTILLHQLLKTLLTYHQKFKMKLLTLLVMIFCKLT